MLLFRLYVDRLTGVDATVEWTKINCAGDFLVPSEDDIEMIEVNGAVAHIPNDNVERHFFVESQPLFPGRAANSCLETVHGRSPCRFDMNRAASRATIGLSWLLAMALGASSFDACGLASCGTGLGCRPQPTKTAVKRTRSKVRLIEPSNCWRTETVRGSNRASRS